MSTPAAPAADPWWSYAVGTATALRSGKEPPTVAVHGPFLNSNEVARLSSPATYSRLATGDGNYERAQAPFMVNPVLMAAAMAGQGVVNNRRRREADRNSQPQWTNYREAAVLTTNQRLMCSRPQGGWTSFWYSEMAEFYPDPHQRAVTMSFADDHTPPLQLAGHAAPAIALWIGHSVYGDRWHEDPRLAALLPRQAAQDTTTHQQASTEPTATVKDGLTPEQHAWWEHHRPRHSRHHTSQGGMEL